MPVLLEIGEKPFAPSQACPDLGQDVRTRSAPDVPAGSDELCDSVGDVLRIRLRSEAKSFENREHTSASASLM
jgi:hypothetical protein